jgi:hypothetical protein
MFIHRENITLRQLAVAKLIDDNLELRRKVEENQREIQILITD